MPIDIDRPPRDPIADREVRKTGRRHVDRWRGRRAGAAGVLAAGVAVALTLPPASGAAPAADALLSQGRPATASSFENPVVWPASAAVDGDLTTRWSSAFSDPQWLQVDLGSTATLSQVELDWETAHAAAYRIQTSPDASTWTTVYSTSTAPGGTEKIPVSGTGRYVRMYATARATGYGDSLWEFKVFGTTGNAGPTPTPRPTGTISPTASPSSSPTATPTPTTTPTGPARPTSDTPDLGPNVAVFDPSMTSATIQAKLDSVFGAQKLNQFGHRRDALLFKPGNYSGIYANIGYYTSIAGLGQSPDDVAINGAVTVDAFDGTGNATQNFWRSAENFSLTPVGGSMRWAVAQAAPFRRVHVRGNLQLFPASYGWASGGYIADSKIDGEVSSASQQQWYSRDSSFGSWQGANWNMVFSGVNGAPAQTFPTPPYTTLPTTPVSREKPFLYLDGAGKYQVFVPSLRTDARGASWTGGTTPGSSIPMSRFYVAKPGVSAATLNQALAQGLNLFFTPGVYNLDQTLRVTRPDTVVLGIGLATLIPDNGVTAISTADVNGIRLAGLLVDAGTTRSAQLIRVGDAGSSGDHAGDPTSLQDVFVRVGGDIAGKSGTDIEVNSNNVLVDHIWDWRADHGNAGTVGWNINTSEQGLVVNGRDVLATGLFVEHQQKHEVVWNGENGRTIFFQNEMPYDVPNQASWNSAPGVLGYASYKVADTVKRHEAWGLGSYCYFNVDPSIQVSHAFEVPNTPGVVLHDMATVSLGGNGTILHVANNAGGPAQGTATVPSYLIRYP